MRFIFGFFFVFGGSMAFAECPSLAGHFECKSRFINMPDFELNIEQSSDSVGNTVYSITRRELPDGEAGTVEYITDGLAYDIVDEDGVTYQLTSSCVDQGFRSFLEGDREDLGHVTVESVHSLDRRDRLIIENKATTDRHGDFGYEDRCERI